MGLLREMKGPVVTMVVRLELMRSVKIAVKAWSEVQWSLGSILWTNGDGRHSTSHWHPNRASDYRYVVLIDFFFSSLLLPLMAR
jgi:hypothetical protein